MTTMEGPRTDAGSIEPGRLVEALVAAQPAATAGRNGDIRVVRAPGRVNLIGEHTDYNLGFVMPAAIGLEIRIAALPSDDRRIEIDLLATGERGVVDLDAIGPPRKTWLDYVAGTAWALQEAGISVTGFRGVLGSDLPQGAGLSSSAAFEMAVTLALTGAAETVDGARRAVIARRAENAYVGVPCGVMDQFASACGVAGDAILLDCRSLETRPVPLPEHVSIVVCHSGSSRRLDAVAYEQRQDECRRAVVAIAEIDPSVASLRDVTPELLDAAASRMDAVATRRARHVVEENARVLDAERAFAGGDLAGVGRLFAASHESLRDLYEVSSPELDALVAIASQTPGVVGARLTGAGFGGSTVNLVRRDAVPTFRAAIERDYPARTGLTPTVIEVEAVGGASVMAADR
jgi:galactokinase